MPPSRKVKTFSRRGVLATGAALLACGPARAATLQLDVEMDYSAAPQLQAYAEEVKRRAFGWWGIINDALSFPGYRPATRIFMRFANDMPLGKAGLTHDVNINLNAPYIIEHPVEYNLVAHEMVHVYQHYQHPTPVWLVEGVADYVRYYVMFPQDRERLYDPSGADYNRGYTQGAALLDWVERTHGVGSVRLLNATLYHGGNGEKLLSKMTGLSLDQIWAKVIADLADGSPTPVGKAGG
jgi:hypothetical protein